MSAIYACTSHLLVDLPLFGGPVVMIAAALALITRAERRRARPGSPSIGEPRQEPRLPASSGT